MRSSHRSSDSIPFSWSLLVISLLSFFVWSVGVHEAPARDYFVRQQQSFGAGYINPSFDSHFTNSLAFYIEDLSRLLREHYKEIQRAQLVDFTHHCSTSSDRVQQAKANHLDSAHAYTYLYTQITEQTNDATDAATTATNSKKIIIF